MKFIDFFNIHKLAEFFTFAGGGGLFGGRGIVTGKQIKRGL